MGLRMPNGWSPRKRRHDLAFIIRHCFRGTDVSISPKVVVHIRFM